MVINGPGFSGFSLVTLLLYHSSLVQDSLAFQYVWISVDGPGTSGFSIDISVTFLLYHSSLAQDYLDFQVGWLPVDGPGASGFSIDILYIILHWPRIIWLSNFGWLSVDGH